jgi:cell division transport system permease protein
VNGLLHYFGLHWENAWGALRDLRKQPVASAMTVAVIGIALALPAALNVLVQNGRSVAGGWESVRDFSVYLKTDTSLSDAQIMAGELQRNPLVKKVTLIAADDALEQFRDSSGMGELLNNLQGNPLPHTLVVRPTEAATATQLAGEERRLRKQPQVDLVRIDTDWVARLNAILDLLRRSVWFAAGLLVAAVVIIIGNTIRLDIQNRRDEIEILKLLGASNGFVRRPFLYVGLWYGVTGSLVALVVLTVGQWALSGPLSSLTGLYDSDFSLIGADSRTLVALLAGGVLAGWGGAWTAVSRHLAAIQPR